MPDEYKEDSPEEFDPSMISEEILSLIGIFHSLKNVNEGQELMLHFKHGGIVMGKKVFFDERLGIIAIHAKFAYKKESALNSNQVIEESVDVYSRYRASEIAGVSTFPKIKK